MTSDSQSTERDKKAKTTHLYLVRHGATDANLRRPYILQGRGIDKSLSETGRKQAEAVGRFLSDVPFENVYSSGMKRARETGQAIAEHHGMQVEPIEDLAECDVGLWEGKDWETIKREHPDAHQAFIENPAKNAYLGGECYQDVLNRVLPVFTELLDRHRGGAIAVVAHNVVNRVYLAHILGIDLGRAQDIRQSNGGVNVIRRERRRIHVMALNTYFHLDESLR